MNMGVAVVSEVTANYLVLVGNVRGHAGNELQVVHSLLLFGGRSRRSAALCSLSETGADGYSVKKTSYILCPPPT